MNPKTNKLEPLTTQWLKTQSAYPGDFSTKDLKTADLVAEPKLLRPDGTEVPKTWSIFKLGELYEINGYMFKCTGIGESSLMFEPHGPVIIGEDKT